MTEVLGITFAIIVMGFLLFTCVMAVIRFVQFWIGFAEGINEANGDPRGFEVKSNTGSTPVLLKERENDHG